MNNSHFMLAGPLFISWAILLSMRTLSAAIYATSKGGSYDMGLEHIGPLMLISAWLSFAAAVIVLIVCRSHTPK